MLRGTKQAITKPDGKLNVNIPVNIHNRFDIEVRDAKTGEVKQKVQAFNVVCDAIWNRILTGNAYFNYILYGSGSGTPSASDTTLFTLISYVGLGNVTTDYDLTQGWCSVQKRGTINETTAVGQTITEIGIGYDGTHCVTHAMLQDMNGNPITITKTDTDIITFYATVFVHWNSNGYQNGKILITENAAKGWFSNLAGNGTFGLNQAVYTRIGKTFYAALGGKSASPVVNTTNKSLTWTFSRFAVGESNGAIRSLTLGDVAMIDVDYFGLSNYAITGESIGTGDGETTDFASHFPIKTGAIVYVDGQPVTTTIDYGLSYLHDISGDIYSVTDDLNFYQLKSTSLITGPGTEYFRNANHRNISSVYVASTGWGTAGSASVFVSNDGETWYQVADHISGSSAIIPSEYLGAEYFKFIKYNASSGSSFTARRVDFYTDATDTNIHFQTPLPAGAVITADYVPDCIPKDTDHVLDVSVTLTLGAYSGNA